MTRFSPGNETRVCLIHGLFFGLTFTALALSGGAAWACKTAAVDAHWNVQGRVLMFPSAADPLRQGFVRVINRSHRAGEVRILAVDDSGRPFDPLTLAIDGLETVHFNSNDLEIGHPDKGLAGSTGAGDGNWRLDFSSELDIDVLSYVRTNDGLVAAMHDIAAMEAGNCRVPIFNPGSNQSQVSVLRLVNLGAEEAAVTVRGIDDRGAPGLGEVGLQIAAGAARSFTARELESGGSGLEGRLGDGSGKWRLVVEAEQPVVAMSLLQSPTGHLTNLSAAPEPHGDGVHRVPLFPPAGDTSGRQGFVRVVNRSDGSGEVRIRAYDETDRNREPLTLSIGANETVHFNSDDLEEGGRKGLSAGTGRGAGDWRLELTSDLDIDVLAYIRTQDGFLTSMHDVAPRTGNRHRVAVFNPGSNPNQVSRLRLVNPGEASAAVTITGVDDRGESPGTPIEVTIPAGGARELGAAELESGDGLEGALGDGSGKWSLLVESVEPVLAMSLLESPTGHLMNLSRIMPRWDPMLIEDHFVETTLGAVGGIPVAVVDGRGFEPGTHGQRITDVFLANTDRATLVQIGEWGEYQHHGVVVNGINSRGYIRHALRHRAGIFWTASDESPLYQPGRSGWLMVGNRPFYARTRTFARWARDENVLFVGSLENTSSKPSNTGGFDADYCDDFDPDAEDWIPLCGAVDDFIAHLGTGVEKVIFAAAIDRFGYGNAAIRADGVFAPHTIYVESPNGSTSQATPVLAAYATNLSFANPGWGAARLKRELMDLAREETIDHGTGEASASGNERFERRTVRVIRPEFAPGS